MNDARFKELLNLYLDHCLTETDAAELEAEVQRNPGRRRIYNGYCRMQRACNVLFENECQRAPQSVALTRALAEVNRKIAGEEPAARQFAWLGWSGALAAACVVVVSVTVAMRNVPGEPSSLAAADETGGVTAPVAPHATVLASVQPIAPTVAPVASPVPVAATVVMPSIDQQILSRLAAQRWIDAEAESLMASRLVEDDRFIIHHSGDNGDVPSFQARQFMGASARGELTTYQFQR